MTKPRDSASDLKKKLGECKATKYADLPITVNIDRLPPSWADASLVRQLFGYLLENAFKFSRPQSSPKIEIGCAPDEHANVYFIRDNGVGFDMKYADKLFGLFQKLHQVELFEGNGAGLALSQRILSRLGGRIWAEAKVNDGATFYFSLPAANPEPGTN